MTLLCKHHMQRYEARLAARLPAPSNDDVLVDPPNPHDPTAAAALHRPAAVQEAIYKDMSRILDGKTLPQLTTLEGSIQVKLRGDVAVDVEYWEALLKEIQVYKAMVCVFLWVHA